MNRHPLSGAVLAALLCASAASFAAGTPRERYVVSLAEPALPGYDATPLARDAKGKALAPTAPAATGRRKLDLSSPAAIAYRAHLVAKQDAVIAQASAKIGRKIAPGAATHLTLAGNAIVLELDADEAARVRAIDGVVSVRADTVHRLLTDAGPRWIGAEPVWNGTVPGSPVRTRGEGVVVGVLDTGINWAHPSFADVSGDGYDHANARGHYYGTCIATPSHCNDKLIGIWDLTDEGAEDGADNVDHGSHVASTIAGNVYAANVPVANIPATVSGVAPRANLISYKVCRRPVADPQGESLCYSNFMLEALEQAISDDVDVLNASIGGDPLDPWQSVRTGGTDLASAWLNVRAAGIVAVLAAGNDGPQASTVSGSANAPWVIAAANATHDRVFGTVLGVQSANESYALNGAGATPGLSRRAVVDAAAFGNALCGRGESQGVTPTGASNPFAPNTFHGEIVVCRRGIYARVEKGYNVLQAGAGGMVLANTEADAESIVTDAHFLPTVHLGHRDAQRLAATMGAGAVTADILGVRPIRDAAFGDVLNASSSRGPVVPFGGWLKPDITAPGTNILAASDDGGALEILSGTSMASPHVASAAALVRAANPTWTVSQIESALLTTGVGDVRLQDGTTAASPHDAGGGRVNIADAVRAALSFETTRQAFVAADPVNDLGAVRALNRPSLVHPACFERCTLRRTVTAARAGSWRVEARMPAGATTTVTPSTFTLAAGGTQAIDVAFDLSTGTHAGRWVDGAIALVPTTAGAVEQRLPVAVFADAGALPATIAITADADGGYRDVPVSGVIALPDAVFTAGELAPLESVTQSVSADPANERDDPYINPANGGLIRTLTVGAGAYRVHATATGGSADVDLYVGRDLDADGVPEANEEICHASTDDATERCAIDVAIPPGTSATYWLYARNGSSSGARMLTLEYAAIPAPDADRTEHRSLVATGPGHVDTRAPFAVRVAWNESRLAPGRRFVGRIAYGATRAEPFALGESLVTLVGGASVARTPILMNARGDSRAITLEAGGAHDRIAVDVPPGATRLVVDLEVGAGADLDLYVARSDAASTGPEPAPAPARGLAQGTSIHPGAVGEHVVIEGAALTPGRWYLTPVNAGTGRGDGAVSVAVTPGAATPVVRDNAYLNPARGGHGLFFSDIGTQWAVIWYTYREDGSPAWYLAQAEAPADADVAWRAPLRRFTWNGRENLGTVVGHVLVTPSAADRFFWSWQLDGRQGSEPMQPIAARPDCPTVGGARIDYTGGWYAPALGGYGFSVLTLASVETEVAYLFDGDGAPRWLYAQNAPFGAGTFALTQLRGFCPQCAAVAPTVATAGTLTRAYTDARHGQHAVQATFTAPVVPSGWNTTHATEKLTLDLSCQ